jgi:hypothetical protein
VTDAEVVAAAEGLGYELMIELRHGEPSWTWTPRAQDRHHARWSSEHAALNTMRRLLADKTG